MGVSGDYSKDVKGSLRCCALFPLESCQRYIHSSYRNSPGFDRRSGVKDRSCEFENAGSRNVPNVGLLPRNSQSTKNPPSALVSFVAWYIWLPQLNNNTPKGM